MKIRKCKICPEGMGDIEGTDHFMTHFCKHTNLLENFPEWVKITQICYDFFLEDSEE